LERASAVINSEPDPLQPANKIHPAVGPEVAAILDKAMALRPEQRYANATDFREALRRVGRINIDPVKARVDRPAEAASPNAKDASPNEETEVHRQNNSAPRLAMVELRRRFSLGAIAALLLVIFAVTFAMLLNSQSPTVSRGNGTVANAGDSKQEAPRKAERASLNDSA